MTDEKPKLVEINGEMRVQGGHLDGLRAGDRVTSFCYGDGVVTYIMDKSYCPIRVQCNNGRICYFTLDGKVVDNDKNPDLYFAGTVFDIKPAPRPKRLVEKTRPFYVIVDKKNGVVVAYSSNDLERLRTLQREHYPTIDCEIQELATKYTVEE